MGCREVADMNQSATDDLESQIQAALLGLALGGKWEGPMPVCGHIGGMLRGAHRPNNLVWKHAIQAAAAGVTLAIVSNEKCATYGNEGFGCPGSSSQHGCPAWRIVGPILIQVVREKEERKKNE